MGVIFTKIAGAPRYVSSNGWSIGKAKGFHVYWYADPVDSPPKSTEDHQLRARTLNEVKEWVRRQV